MVDSLKVTVTDSFSQSAHEGSDWVAQQSPDIQMASTPVLPEAGDKAIIVNRSLLDGVESSSLDLQAQKPVGGLLSDCIGAATQLTEDCVGATHSLKQQVTPVEIVEPESVIAKTWDSEHNYSPNFA